ncbi:MAG: YkgJ family cysteine cluster protein [Desulfobacterales bacterium]|nr:YkgJ family cysteine cluster protein [Desulfobacterales bacterium]
MNPKLIPLSLNDSFCFSCSPDVPCFNECCRDLNQFLTPYDILGLKNLLGLSSEEFLVTYTSQHIGPESGLPIISLKPNDPRELICPFVTEKGCQVYKNRPSSCRTYPLVRSVSRSRQTGKTTEQYMVLKEPHCHGFDSGESQTVLQWIDDQKLTIYNETNDKLMRLISLKNRLMPGPLNIKSRKLFHLALYDLDNFRSQILNNGLLDSFDADSAGRDSAVADDVALLELGMQWVAHALFGVK